MIQNFDFYFFTKIKLSSQSFTPTITEALNYRLNHLQQKEQSVYSKLGIGSANLEAEPHSNITKHYFNVSEEIHKAIQLQNDTNQDLRAKILDCKNPEKKKSLIDLLKLQIRKHSLILCMESHLQSEDFPTRRDLYYCNEFNLIDKPLDLVINSMIEDLGVLTIDACLVNLTDYPIKEIKDFDFLLRDTYQKVFAEKKVEQLLNETLMPYEDKRIVFHFSPDEFNLCEANTSRVSWSYHY